MPAYNKIIAVPPNNNAGRATIPAHPNSPGVDALPKNEIDTPICTKPGTTSSAIRIQAAARLPARREETKPPAK